MIVSEVAGTTRDAIDTPIEVDGRKLILVDTAGIRRAGQGHASRSSTTRRCAPSGRPSAPTSRSSSATPRTASPPQDLRIAELAMKSGCATALVLNKWDVTGGDGDPLGPGGGIGADELDAERARVNQQAAPAPAGADRLAP